MDLVGLRRRRLCGRHEGFPHIECHRSEHSSLRSRQRGPELVRVDPFPALHHIENPLAIEVSEETPVRLPFPEALLIHSNVLKGGRELAASDPTLDRSVHEPKGLIPGDAQEGTGRSEVGGSLDDVNGEGLKEECES